MEILIGLVLIAGGIGFAVFQYRRNGARMQETQYMQTTAVKDALEIVEDMMTTDPSYRHYVELKGNLVCNAPLNAPFSNRMAAYYVNRCLSVSEETSVYQDSEGNRRTRTTKRENEISSERQSADTYLQDGSCQTPVFVNFDSFGGDIDLIECCDRFEPSGSQWASRYGSRYRSPMYAGGRFLGYRLIEKIFPAEGPVYVLGELMRLGDRYVIEKAHASRKPSLLSYKSEEQIVQDHKHGQVSAVIVGGVAVLAGIFMIVMQLT